jgi:2-hydroxychromene-2-carboxylate isomerase
VPADLELFFDPVCPFCWVTSRWIEEVLERTGTTVRHRPISLRMLNPDEAPDSPLGLVHARGLQLLRVVQAAADTAGDEAVARLYTLLGQAIHEQGVADAEDFGAVAAVQSNRPQDLRRVLREAGLPEALAEAANDPTFDAAIKHSTETARARAGEDVGTPVLTFDPPDGPSFFGPILSEVPRGDRAVELFEATRTLAEHQPFTELKRSLRELPEVAALASLR